MTYRQHIRETKIKVSYLMRKLHPLMNRKSNLSAENKTEDNEHPVIFVWHDNRDTKPTE